MSMQIQKDLQQYGAAIYVICKHLYKSRKKVFADLVICIS